jgi:hypothetical protein
VRDVQVLTKYCKGCANIKDNKEKLELREDSDVYEVTFSDINFGMEAAGAVAIFESSDEGHDARCTSVLGM